MLELTLHLQNNQGIVYANGKESHQFSLLDLSQSKEEWKIFFDNPRIYGEKLFNVLFKNIALTEFEALAKQPERSIILILESPELNSIAWEYSYNKAKEEYIVEEFAFMRALPESERPLGGKLKSSYKRLPLLFIPANPLVDLNGEPMPALDVDSEWKVITRHILTSNAPLDLIQLRPPTPEDLLTMMANFRDGLIVHFSGHGAITSDGAVLLFEEKNGASRKYLAKEFIRTVKDQTILVFLSACQSAVTGKTEFSNLSRELVKAGVPFALGMQFNLPDKYDDTISQQFYNYLARGYTIPEATLQARRAIKNEAKKTNQEFFVGIIVLYCAHPNEKGKLEWNDENPNILNTFRHADVSDLPAPTNGLIGRQSELMRIGTKLVEGKNQLTLTLHGMGGIGKTALLWQTLQRFAPSFDLTLALRLDILPSLESVLGRIERFLALPSPCSNDAKEREAIVQNILISKHTLLGLDNFETLNYALNEKGSDEEKAAKSLHSFFKNLAANSVILCVTSREITNLPGEIIEDIQGLTNESGGRLFQENVVKHKNEIYIDKTRQLSEKVDGHPLALRLLASAFDDQLGMSLNQYIESLQAFLPTARDRWTEEARHESLRASFDFTMNNLLKTDEGTKLNISLSKLSIFIGFFVDFISAPVLEDKFADNEDEAEIMYTNTEKILQNLWARGLLERTSILLESEEKKFLYRLHPALSKFVLESITSKDLNALQEMHWKIMCRLGQQAYPASQGSGVFGSTFLANIVRFAIPDMLKATKFKQNEENTIILFLHIAFLQSYFGYVDEAINSYKRVIEIADRLDLKKNKLVALHSMAELYVRFGDLDKALELYKQSIVFSESLGDMQGKAANLQSMAEIYRIWGDLDKAMSLLVESLEIASVQNNKKNIAAVLSNIANIYLTRGKLSEALKFYTKSLEIFENLGNLRGKAEMLNEISVIYTRQGDLESALKLSLEALDIANSLHDELGKANNFHQIANIYTKYGDIDKAINFYANSFQIKDQLGDIKGKAVTLYQLAHIYVDRRDLNEAMQLFMESFELYEKLGDLHGKAISLGGIAGVELMQKNIGRAIALQEQALSITKQINDPYEISTASSNLALSYELNNDLDKAYQLYGQSIEIDISMGILQTVSTRLNRMAGILVMLDDLDGAMKIYQLALQKMNLEDDLQTKAASLLEEGQSYVFRNKFEDALKLSLQANAIYEKLESLQGKAETFHQIASILFLRGDKEEAMQWFKETLVLRVELGDLKGKALTLNNMANIFHSNGDYELSLQYFIEALAIQESVGAEENARITANSIAGFQQLLGEEQFLQLWNKVTNKTKLPKWLKRNQGKGSLFEWLFNR